MPCLGSPGARAQISDCELQRMQATVPAKDVQVHEHEEAHLVLVLRGTYVSDAVDMPPECGEPALVFNPPGTRHRDRFAQPGGYFVSISLPPAAWDRYWPHQVASVRARRLGIDALAAALRLASTLGSCDSATLLDREADMDALLQVAAWRPQKPVQRAPKWLGRARDRLLAADEPCSLGELALDCGVQPAQLSRAFRSFEGCTPGQFLRRHRLQRVITQWTREEWGSLTDAAHAAGFFDHAHMIRAMRQEVGTTPSELRSMLWAACGP
ncbi:helix-turn-helix transcriptional regulator [Arenimonas aestuarii]